jgi:hypothetical protein
MSRPTVSQPVYLGVQHPSGGPRPDFYCCQTVAVLLMCGVLSVERTGLSITIAADPRQLSHSRVRVPQDSWPYFTLSNLLGQVPVFISPRKKVAQLCPRHWIPLSSHPTTRRVRVEILEPASVRGLVSVSSRWLSWYRFRTERTENTASNGFLFCVTLLLSRKVVYCAIAQQRVTYLVTRHVVTCCIVASFFAVLLPSNSCLFQSPRHSI